MKSADGYSCPQRICSFRKSRDEIQRFIGKVVGKGQERLESSEMNLRAGTPVRCVERHLRLQNSESVLATVVNTSNPCLLGNTHIVLGGWPGKVKGYECLQMTAFQPKRTKGI